MVSQTYYVNHTRPANPRYPEVDIWTEKGKPLNILISHRTAVMPKHRRAVMPKHRRAVMPKHRRAVIPKQNSNSYKTAQK